MESNKQIRSSAIARSMRFNGLFRPLHQEKMRIIEKQNQPIQKWSSNSNYGFKVTPTKELCRVYLHKPDLLASKGIIDAQAKPPHQRKCLKSKMHGEVANHRKFGRRFDQQNLKLKLRHHHSSVDHPKSKILKKENSLRWFSPLGFGSGSQLRDKKKGQYFTTLEKKLCAFVEKKDRVVREVGSKLMVSTCRDSALSFEPNRVAAADVRFRDISSSGFISKVTSMGLFITLFPNRPMFHWNTNVMQIPSTLDIYVDLSDELQDENEDSSDCASNASPCGCQTNSEEAHQPSPVSVLEPMFDDDDVLDDCEEISDLDLHGKENRFSFCTQLLLELDF